MTQDKYPRSVTKSTDKSSRRSFSFSTNDEDIFNRNLAPSLKKFNFLRPKSPSGPLSPLPISESDPSYIIPEPVHKSNISPEDDVCFPLDQEESGIDYTALSNFLKSQDNIVSLNEYESEKRFMFYSKYTGSISVSNFWEFSSLGSSFYEALQSGNFWLDVTASTENEMKALSRIFHIHPLTVEDILTEEIREKCELFKQYYFVCFRAYEQNSSSISYLDPQSVYNVVFKESIVSFHSKPLYHTTSVLRRIEQLKDFIAVSPDWINYAIIDDITDSFAPMMRHIEFEVDAIDELVLILKESEQSDMLRRIGHARKKVTMLLRLLTTKPDVIKALSMRCDDRLKASKGPDIKLYLGDIQDHLITMVQNSLHYEKVLARAHSNYLAQISIELTQVSNRTNDVVAKLTAIASILLPMNVITGLWGMNVHVPGQYDDYQEGYAWFFGILGFMCLLALAAFFFVRKSGLF